MAQDGAVGAAQVMSAHEPGVVLRRSGTAGSRWPGWARAARSPQGDGQGAGVRSRPMSDVTQRPQRARCRRGSGRRQARRGRVTERRQNRGLGVGLAPVRPRPAALMASGAAGGSGAVSGSGAGAGSGSGAVTLRFRLRSRLRTRGRTGFHFDSGASSVFSLRLELGRGLGGFHEAAPRSMVAVRSRDSAVWIGGSTASATA